MCAPTALTCPARGGEENSHVCSFSDMLLASLLAMLQGTLRMGVAHRLEACGTVMLVSVAALLWTVGTGRYCRGSDCRAEQSVLCVRTLAKARTASLHGCCSGAPFRARGALPEPRLPMQLGLVGGCQNGGASGCPPKCVDVSRGGVSASMADAECCSYASAVFLSMVSLCARRTRVLWCNVLLVPCRCMSHMKTGGGDEACVNIDSALHRCCCGSLRRFVWSSPVNGILVQCECLSYFRCVCDWCCGWKSARCVTAAQRLWPRDVFPGLGPQRRGCV